MTIGDYTIRFPELKSVSENADYIDVKITETTATLREFIASMLSYYPWWLILLYRIRGIVVRILGLAKQELPEKMPCLKPDDIPLTPGETATFFTVRIAKDGVCWVGEAPEDKHLKAYLAVAVGSSERNPRRFYVITIVHYKHWTGPVYFNLIRPFHHLVVGAMVRAGAKGVR